MTWWYALSAKETEQIQMAEEMFNPACLSDFQLSAFRHLQAKNTQETPKHLWINSITLTITTIFFSQRREIEANIGTYIFWVI